MSRAFTDKVANVDLDFVVLADAVVARPDGKLDIMGAGWDTVHAVAVPAQHPRLVLAVRVLLSRHETEHPHWIDVVIQATDGRELARARGDIPALPDEARAEIAPGNQFGLAMVLNFENVVFLDYGNHQVVVQWDGKRSAPTATTPRQAAVGGAAVNAKLHPLRPFSDGGAGDRARRR